MRPTVRISAPVNSRRRVERRPGKRAQAPQSEPSADEAAPEGQRPSRSARKRQALALQELGVRLTWLKPAQLQQLPLPEQLLVAVLEARQLKSRAALARQRQYIGKLMRSLDAEAIERALSDAGRVHSPNDKLR